MPPRKKRPPERMIKHELGQVLYYLCIAARLASVKKTVGDLRFAEVFASTVKPTYARGRVVDSRTAVDNLSDDPNLIKIAEEVSKKQTVREILSKRFNFRFTAL